MTLTYQITKVVGFFPYQSSDTQIIGEVPLFLILDGLERGVTEVEQSVSVVLRWPITDLLNLKIIKNSSKQIQRIKFEMGTLLYSACAR